MPGTEQINVAIVGASGYSGEELIRLLLRHPQAKLACVTSRQYAERPVGEVFPRFAGLDLMFSAPSADQIAELAEVVFLALPHGLAAEFALPLFEKGLRVIDISADFRLRDPAVYRQYYGVEHPAVALLDKAVYGLPELYRDQLRHAQLVACPGCYPTSVLLPVCPLLSSSLVTPENIAVCSISGVSGAGRKVELPFIFPECNESLRAYAATDHRHLPEIEQELAKAAGRDQSAPISFIPHLAPVNRGIHSTILLTPSPGTSIEKVRECWHCTYADEPFVRILADRRLADTKHVAWTNAIEFGCAFDQHTGRLIVSSAIDNLVKGASGQAVQCMNIMGGLEETMGLR